jgi:hypothetical protein
MTTPTTILVIPGDGSGPIPCEVLEERDGVYLLDDGELQWAVRVSDVRDGKVQARLVFLAEN